MATLTDHLRLQCGSPLHESARAVLEGRLSELEATRARIASGADSEALHDLRIAAKRLRYSLEMFAVCFPADVASELADGVRSMQDILGRIHDLDVLHALLVAQVTDIETSARIGALQVALSPGSVDERERDLIDRVTMDGKADGRLGVYKVMAVKGDERKELYDRFVDLWAHWQDAGFLTMLRATLSSA